MSDQMKCADCHRDADHYDVPVHGGMKKPCCGSSPCGCRALGRPKDWTVEPLARDAELARLRNENAALRAERDALAADLGTECSRLMNLVSRVTGAAPALPTNESVGEAMRVAGELRARAIPAKWVERARSRKKGAELHVIVTDRDTTTAVLMFGRCVEILRDGNLDTEHTTLAAALDAAAKETT